MPSRLFFTVGTGKKITLQIGYMFIEHRSNEYNFFRKRHGRFIGMQIIGLGATRFAIFSKNIQRNCG